MNNTTSLPANIVLDWEKANQIKETSRTIYEVPMRSAKPLSIRPEGAKLVAPLSQLLLIYKNADGHSYAIADFMPDWDYAFAYSLGKGGMSFTNMFQYKGTVLFRDMNGKILDGYQFDGSSVKRWARKGNTDAQTNARVTDVECIAVTYNYYTMVCTPYGCSTNFDYSETNIYCSGGGGGNGGGPGEFIPSGGGGGNSNGSGITGYEVREIITQEVPSRAELNNRFGDSFEDQFVKPLRNMVEGKNITISDVENFIAAFDGSVLVDNKNQYSLQKVWSRVLVLDRGQEVYNNILDWSNGTFRLRYDLSGSVLNPKVGSPNGFIIYLVDASGREFAIGITFAIPTFG